MLKASALLAALLLVALSGTRASADDAIDRALARVGLTKQTGVVDQSGMALYGGAEFVLPIFTTLHENPYRIPDYAPALKAEVERSAGSLQELTRLAAVRSGEGVRRGWITQPLAVYEKKIAAGSSLADAVTYVLERSGIRKGVQETGLLRRQAQDVPKIVADSAALILYAAAQAADWRDQAFAGTFDREELGRLFGHMPPEIGTEDKFDQEMYKLVHSVDLKLLQCGAADLAEAVDKAVKAMTAAEPPGGAFHFACDTPLGRIAINGADTDLYDDSSPYLLIIDTGGDDVYRQGGATVGYDNPVSVLIDLAGRDVYKTEKKHTPAFGAGVMGYGYLVDVAGDDRYEGPDLSQGVGILGTGALLDMAGNDEYTGVSDCQGVGVFGVGVLSDLAGNDHYDIYTVGQGFGGTKGVGILVDLAGRDVYTANDTDIRFPASQTSEHNGSLAQGAGFGRRADYTDGHSLAGGLGMLVDGGGNDKYSCGVFGQGVGYWYGVGILADTSGDDEYTGVWYVQGSGAHFACGILWDGSGSDRHKATMNMAMGAGHDFTVGCLIDEQGDDVYEAPNLGLGAGNANGLGLFWDKAGDDTYTAASDIALGRSAPGSGGALRDLMLCLGLFVDTGGADTYPGSGRAKNNSVWVSPAADWSPAKGTEVGVGIDEG